MINYLLHKKKQFIFIHIYKNAGTSIKNALSPYANVWRQRLANKRALRNVTDTSSNFSLPFPGHIKAKELINKIGEDAFNQFFSFAIVRNPWDWQVSLYKYMLRNVTHPQHELIKGLGSFEAYIQWRCAKEVRLQKDFLYSVEGKLLIDYVGKFENINDDFFEICSQIGVSASLPRLNVSNRKPYQEYYSNMSKDLVGKIFKEDIKLFKYSFDS